MPILLPVKVFSPVYTHFISQFSFIDEKYYLPHLGSYISLSLLGSVLFSYGVMGLFIIYFLIDIFLIKPFVMKKRMLLKFGVLSFVFSLFLVLSSTPFLYPPLWLLLGITLNYLFYNKAKKY